MSDLTQAIAALRKLCNEEIARANRYAYREYPSGPVINTPVGFGRMNDMLKACDAVFSALDKEGRDDH